MNNFPRPFAFIALCLVLAMAWANQRGYMVSSLFNDTTPASRGASGHLSHK
jgi:hypothetical protein